MMRGCCGRAPLPPHPPPFSSGVGLGAHTHAHMPCIGQSIKAYTYNAQTGSPLADSCRTVLCFPKAPHTADTHASAHTAAVHMSGAALEALEATSVGVGGKVGTGEDSLHGQAEESVYGEPGGIAVDSEGFLWVPLDAFSSDAFAHRSGSSSSSASPPPTTSSPPSPSGLSSWIVKVNGVTGDILQRIKLGSRRPSACAFGDSLLDSLYVTTRYTLYVTTRCLFPFMSLSGLSSSAPRRPSYSLPPPPLPSLAFSFALFFSLFFSFLSLFLSLFLCISLSLSRWLVLSHTHACVRARVHFLSLSLSLLFVLFLSIPLPFPLFLSASPSLCILMYSRSLSFTHSPSSLLSLSLSLSQFLCIEMYSRSQSLTLILQAPPNLHPFVLEGLVRTKTFSTVLLGVAYSVSKSESSSSSEVRNYDHHR